MRHWDALKGKKLVVVDASVILKWVLPEEQEENVLEALFLRDAIVAETVSGLVPALIHIQDWPALAVKWNVETP